MQPKMLVNLVDGKHITISPSGLSGAVENPHTFWLEKNMKFPWPRGIFPSLPGGMDLALKPYYDYWRSKGELPPEARGQGITGRLMHDQATIDRWRSRGRNGMLNTVVTHEVDGILYGVAFQGMVDDMVEEDDHSLSIFDFKTKGSAPKAGDSERYYGKQMSGYALLLERNGRHPSGKAHLAYYYPDKAEARAAGGGVVFNFNCQVEHLRVCAEECEALVKSIIVSLVRPLPELNEHEACLYLNAYRPTVEHAKTAKVGLNK